MWEEEESQLQLASEQEKRWLVELAEQRQREWMAKERVEGSLKSRENSWKEETGDCWGVQSARRSVCQ